MASDEKAEQRANEKWAMLGKSPLPHEQLLANSASFYESGRNQIDFIIGHAKELGITIRPGLALDFGSGIGRLSQGLCRYFSKVIGVDVWEPVVTQARSLNQYGSKCEYVINKKQDLSQFADNKFDMITSYIVLQHIHPDFSVKYIEEFARLLRSGGFLVFQLPSKRKHETRMHHMRFIVSSKLPTPMLKAIINLRYGSAERTTYEMYEMRKEKVIRLLEGLGLKVVDVLPDRLPSQVRDITDHLSGWDSFIYWAVKK